MTSRMQIAIIGARGQIGSEVMRAAGAAGFDVLAVDHADCDVRNVSSVERTLAPLRAGDAVVNTAAFHRTDACEEAPDQALSVNALGAFNVAALALAEVRPDAAARLQGAARGVARTLALNQDPPLTAAVAAPASAGFVTALRREATRRLSATLGDEVLNQRRREGEEMGLDDAVAYALAEIDSALGDPAFAQGY